jgi:hypothetical protein
MSTGKRISRAAERHVRRPLEPARRAEARPARVAREKPDVSRVEIERRVAPSTKPTPTPTPSTKPTPTPTPSTKPTPSTTAGHRPRRRSGSEHRGPAGPAGGPPTGRPRARDRRAPAIRRGGRSGRHRWGSPAVTRRPTRPAGGLTQLPFRTTTARILQADREPARRRPATPSTTPTQASVRACGPSSRRRVPRRQRPDAGEPKRRARGRIETPCSPAPDSAPVEAELQRD